MVTKTPPRTRFLPSRADWDWARAQYAQRRNEADIAAELGVMPNTVHRRARAEAWTRTPTLLGRLNALIETELQRTASLAEEGASGAERRARAVLALTRAAALLDELERHDKDTAAPSPAQPDCPDPSSARDAVDRDIDRILASLRAAGAAVTDDASGA